MEDGWWMGWMDVCVCGWHKHKLSWAQGAGLLCVFFAFTCGGGLVGCAFGGVFGGVGVGRVLLDV